VTKGGRERGAEMKRGEQSGRRGRGAGEWRQGRGGRGRGNGVCGRAGSVMVIDAPVGGARGPPTGACWRAGVGPSGGLVAGSGRAWCSVGGRAGPGGKKGGAGGGSGHTARHWAGG